MDDFRSKKVIKDWESMKGCIFAEKCWVNPKNIEVAKSYEYGDFPRVWCNHDDGWCEADLGYECCCIYSDHMEE